MALLVGTRDGVWLAGARPDTELTRACDAGKVYDQARPTDGC